MYITAQQQIEQSALDVQCGISRDMDIDFLGFFNTFLCIISIPCLNYTEYSKMNSGLI